MLHPRRESRQQPDRQQICAHFCNAPAEPPPDIGQDGGALPGAGGADGATKEATCSNFHGEYGIRCDTSPSSSLSGRSMNAHQEYFAPQNSPAQADSPGGAGRTADGFGRLSLEHRRTLSREHLACQRGRALHHEQPALVSKRSASSELTKPGGRQSPRLEASPQKATFGPAARSRASRRGCLPRTTSHDFSAGAGDPQTHAHLPRVGNGVKAPVHKDSGYDSQLPSRCSTGPYCEVENAPHHTHGVSSQACITSQKQCQATSIAEWKMSRQTSITGEQWNIVLQPDSSTISTEQLSAEVKGIYAGLVMVEAKCINIDAAQAADPKSPVGAQWQALIALHRTLLYEHHDFLMATQHPSATPALRGLANKYSMPARMWKHGIHAFLEVLRHRRPQSQDYMLAFIYLAYQMMALLFETVPSFTDTWIECLGDLARYRMAIEEERETHATWGGVAARWYTMASDRHPAIGRLYHHLGILERPSLRKLCLYSKSLTCVLQFLNARDSLSTLCGPIVLDEQTIQSSRQSAEARIVTYHALIVAQRDLDIANSVGQDSLQLLGEQPAKLRDFGAYFAATNIASLFELGSATNALWILYNAAVNQATPVSQSTLGTSVDQSNDTLAATTSKTSISPFLQSTNAYFADSFNFVLQQYDSPEVIKDALPFIHVSLVCLHSLHALRTRLSQHQLHTTSIPFDSGTLSFPALASFLTTLAQQDIITAYMLERARQGLFLGSEQQENARPLSEDYIIRGHIWSQFYFSPGWFDRQSEDDGRAIETAALTKARGARVLWLGLFLAFHTDHLSFDVKTQIFSAATSRTTAFASIQVPGSVHSAAVDLASEPADRTSVLVAPGSAGGTSKGNSSSDSSEDGFTMVKKSPKPKVPSIPGSQRHASARAIADSNASVNSGRKQYKRQDIGSFQIVDENGNISTVV